MKLETLIKIASTQNCTIEDTSKAGELKTYSVNNGEFEIKETQEDIRPLSSQGKSKSTGNHYFELISFKFNGSEKAEYTSLGKYCSVSYALLQIYSLLSSQKIKDIFDEEYAEEIFQEHSQSS